jgi:hypothetical protein
LVTVAPTRKGRQMWDGFFNKKKLYQGQKVHLFLSSLGFLAEA